MNPGLARYVRIFKLDTLFDLRADAKDHNEVVEEVSKNVVFRGTNLWILIFAIVICSVGLNVNSTAVIIGAMLISPLMGPIIGLGVGVGIFDMQLIRKAARNLLIAVGISVASSALYFLISPLSDAQSELLARTTPTLWDVLIAMFGGLAGIVAATRKERTTVIPGVAIATALMPPLCTTGFGLATGNAAYFFGSLYLFFINTVFISVSAFLIVRLLRFPTASFVDRAKEKRVRMIIGAVVLITVLPSVWLAYTLVDRTLFERKAREFVRMEFDMEATQVLETRIMPERGKRTIEVFLMGEPVSDDRIHAIKERMLRADLENAHLFVRQGVSNTEVLDMDALRTGVMEELYNKGQAALQIQEDKNRVLESELSRLRSLELPTKNVLDELRALYPDLATMTLNRNVLYSTDTTAVDTALVAVLHFKSLPSGKDLERLRKWLGQRCTEDSVLVVVR